MKPPVALLQMEDFPALLLLLSRLWHLLLSVLVSVFSATRVHSLQAVMLASDCCNFHGSDKGEIRLQQFRNTYRGEEESGWFFEYVCILFFVVVMGG